MLARLLRCTECMAELVSQGMPTTAVPQHYHGSLPPSAAPNQSSISTPRAVTRKRRRKRVRVEGLYLEREPEPKLHARALLELIQTECPEKVGSFIPRAHFERAYRELCNHQGWNEHSWMTVARALSKLTCRKLLKRNGLRFVAYRVPGAKAA